MRSSKRVYILSGVLFIWDVDPFIFEMNTVESTTAPIGELTILASWSSRGRLNTPPGDNVDEASVSDGDMHSVIIPFGSWIRIPGMMFDFTHRVATIFGLEQHVPQSLEPLSIGCEGPRDLRPFLCLIALCILLIDLLSVVVALD